MTAQSGITEIIGLPGSGKSTVECGIAERGIATVTQWPGLSRVAGIPVAVQLFVRAPLLSIAVYLAVGTRRSVNNLHLRRVHSVQRRHILVRSRRRRHENVVLDEGPLHSLFLTLYATRSTALSRPLLKLAVRLLARHIAHYVYLDIGTENCIANFRRPGRTSLRFNEWSSSTTIDEFRHDRTYAEITDALDRVAASKLLRVDSVAKACSAIEFIAFTRPQRPLA